MSETSWFESFFGEDYFEIYADAFPAERTTMEVEAVVELLGVEPGARILDLACGHGRHAIPLAQRGFHVTGYDLSEVFLDRAEADAKAAGVEIEWIRGDMRELPFDREFEAVINLYTAFGYFADPDDDLRTLQGIQRALEPGGQLLLETLHRDGLLARFRPKITERTGSGVIVLHEYEWDLARNVIDDRVMLIHPDGTRKHYRTSVRMHSLHEFLGLLRRGGLEPTAWHGGLERSPLGLHSRRLVLLSRRAL
jgi:SAM-dependent methyltransferase